MEGLVLSTFDEVKYNAVEKQGYASGDMGKGRPRSRRIYSVYRIEETKHGIFAKCQSRDAFGILYNEAIPVHTLEPWNPPTERTFS